LQRKRGAFPCCIIAVALILNCRIAFAQQDHYSANFIMPGANGRGTVTEVTGQYCKIELGCILPR
jgi:hypothetical protein